MEKLRQNCDETAQEKLIAEFKSGDQNAFTEFSRMYKGVIVKAIWNKCKNQDREDLVQEVLLKIYLNREAFDPSKSRITTWIYNLANNLAIDIYRKKSRATKNEKLTSGFDLLTVEFKVDKIELNQKFIESLSTSEIDLLKMKYVNNMSSKAIAEHFGVRKCTITSRIHQIKEKVRQLYGANAKNSFID